MRSLSASTGNGFAGGKPDFGIHRPPGTARGAEAQRRPCHDENVAGILKWRVPHLKIPATPLGGAECRDFRPRSGTPSPQPSPPRGEGAEPTPNPSREGSQDQRILPLPLGERVGVRGFRNPLGTCDGPLSLEGRGSRTHPCPLQGGEAEPRPPRPSDPQNPLHREVLREFHGAGTPAP